MKRLWLPRLLILALTALLIVAPSKAAALAAGNDSGPKHMIKHAAVGDLSADFSYFVTLQSTYPQQSYSNLRVSIRRSGILIFSQLIDCSQCNPVGVSIARLQRAGERQVLVDLYTGGAHCCYVTSIYVVKPSGTTRLVRSWGDPGYRLEDISHDGVFELVSADDRFAYEFTDFADSAMPVQVWQLRNGVLTNVTRSYPSLIRSDAAHLWRARQSVNYVRGVYAAWAADEALLGRWKQALATLEDARARGDLDLNPSDSITAEQYLAKLQAFLRADGYLT